jgi:hypothetical protein
VNGAGDAFGAGDSVTQFVNAPGVTIGLNTDVVVYGPIGLGGPFGLNFALTTSDPVKLDPGSLGINPGEHMLFAYQAHGGNVTIADVDFQSAIAPGGSTAGATLAISDIVDLPNGPGLIGIAAHPDQIQFISHVG